MDSGLEYEPNDRDRVKVTSLCSFGHPQEDIAKYLDISVDTLVKYYRQELNTALTDTVDWVVKRLRDKIADGDTKAMTFFLQTRGKFRSADKEAEITANKEIARDQIAAQAQKEIDDILLKQKEKTTEY